MTVAKEVVDTQLNEVRAELAAVAQKFEELKISNQQIHESAEKSSVENLQLRDQLGRLRLDRESVLNFLKSHGEEA